VDIEDSIYADFKGIATDLRYDEVQLFQQRLIKCNDARIRFRGLDDSEKLKGLRGFKFIYFNELTQFEAADFDQGRKRLRGMPGQKILADWNPISEHHWIKKEILDKEVWIKLSNTAPDAPTKYCSLNDTAIVQINQRGNMLLIRTNYLDNYWVVGHPSGKGGFRDQHTIDDFEYDRINRYNYYRIYGIGDWGVVKTGSEFWKQFKEECNTRSNKYNPGPIHVTVDSNVRPYVTIGLWQINMTKKEIDQVDELPCVAPDNNATKSAKKLVSWLKKMKHEDVVFLYGDPSGNNSNTIDDENRSFFDKFKDVLIKEGYKVIDRVKASAPSVSLSAAFINDIYEGLLEWRIFIGNHCSVSIDDYNTVQEDKDGGMHKPKIKDPISGASFEPHGHFSDSKRYLITSILDAEFKRYKSRRSRTKAYSV
ncbi:MAG TPA: phage terminase large subunit, partial [Puia sp.]